MNFIKKNDKPIGSVIADFVAKNQKIDQGLNVRKIDVIYFQLMGSIGEKYTKRVSFKEGIMYINVTSSVYKKELLMSANTLKTKINETLGKDLVIKIVVN